jgi:hypothetical protein
MASIALVALMGLALWFLSVNLSNPNLERLPDAPIQEMSDSGFSLEKRKSIYKELMLAEDRALAEAELRVPSPQSRRDLVRQANLWEQLTEKYNLDLCRKVGITKKQLSDIMQEGIMKSWPMSDVLDPNPSVGPSVDTTTPP